jgi:hypothetical protein
MNIMGKPPLGLKDRTRKDAPKLRKPVRRISAKRAAHRKSDAGNDGMDYMGAVKSLPCVACGATHRPRDAHHCKDLPPLGEDGPYQKSPHKHRRTGDYDTIPLCEFYCHNDGPDSFHKNRTAWRERHGPDYGFIPATRAAVAAINGTIDF